VEKKKLNQTPSRHKQTKICGFGKKLKFGMGTFSLHDPFLVQNIIYAKSLIINPLPVICSKISATHGCVDELSFTSSVYSSLRKT
jgi:hypothetical protein